MVLGHRSPAGPRSFQKSTDVIVLDESQQIKNRSSEVSKVVLSLQADCKISLSGAPIENSLSDLWMQMEFIDPATLGSFKDFKEKFLLPIEKRDDPSAKQRLFHRVRPFFLQNQGGSGARFAGIDRSGILFRNGSGSTKALRSHQVGRPQ